VSNERNENEDLLVIFYLEFDSHSIDEYSEVYLQDFHIRKNQKLKQKQFKFLKKTINTNKKYLEVFHQRLESVSN